MLSNLLSKGFQSSLRELSNLIRELSWSFLKISKLYPYVQAPQVKSRENSYSHEIRIPQGFLCGGSRFFCDSTSAGNLYDYSFLIESKGRYAPCNKKRAWAIVSDVSSSVPEIRDVERVWYRKNGNSLVWRTADHRSRRTTSLFMCQ